MKIYSLVIAILIFFSLSQNNALAQTQANNPDPPLKQLRNGVTLTNVICRDDLHLIIRNDGKSAVCVKPLTAIKLVQHGWGHSPNREHLSGNQISQYAPSNIKCDGKLVPQIDYNNNIIPVLLMQPNSTATVCVTYQILENWASYPNKTLYPEGIAPFALAIGRNDKDTPPDLFRVTAIPNMLNVSSATVGSNFTVLYKIYATPNSKGFYDHSIPTNFCSSYPLSVGYAATQVKESDFSPWLYIPPPCAFVLYRVDSVRISGMDYTKIVFHP